MVYSPLDALALRRARPPAPSSSSRSASRRPRPRRPWRCLARVRRARPQLRGLLQPRHDRAAAPSACSRRRGLQIDAFVGPGPRLDRDRDGRPIASSPEEFGRPLVVRRSSRSTSSSRSRCCCGSAREGRCEVENQYTASCGRRAMRARWRRSTRRWSSATTSSGAASARSRESALRLRRAVRRLGRRGAVDPARATRIQDPKACRCGEVLTGPDQRWECGVFGTACTPERHSAHAWSQARERAPPSTRMAVCGVARNRLASRPRRRVRDELITLAHGAGGKATRDLVEGSSSSTSTTRRSPRSGTRPSSREQGASRSRPTPTSCARSNSREATSANSR